MHRHHHRYALQVQHPHAGGGIAETYVIGVNPVSRKGQEQISRIVYRSMAVRDTDNSSILDKGHMGDS